MLTTFKDENNIDKKISESYNIDYNFGEGFKVNSGGIGFNNISDMLLNIDSIISSPKSIGGGLGISLLPASIRVYKSWMIIPNYEKAKKQVNELFYPNTFIVPYNDTFRENNKSSIAQTIQNIPNHLINCGGK